MKGQTRVSMVPEKDKFRLEGAGMLSFGSKVAEKEKDLYELPKVAFWLWGRPR